MHSSKYLKSIGIILGLSVFGAANAGSALSEYCELRYQEFTTEAACQQVRQITLESFKEDNYSNYYVAECSQTSGAKTKYYLWAIAE